MADNQAFLRLIRKSMERLPPRSVGSLHKAEQQNPEAIKKLESLIDTISETVAEQLNERLSVLSKDDLINYEYQIIDRDTHAAIYRGYVGIYCQDDETAINWVKLNYIGFNPDTMNLYLLRVSQASNPSSSDHATLLKVNITQNEITSSNDNTDAFIPNKLPDWQ